jgi:hypothetical protein
MKVQDCKTVGQIIEFYIDKYDLHSWEPGLTVKGAIIVMFERYIGTLLKLRK